MAAQHIRFRFSRQIAGIGLLTACMSHSAFAALTLEQKQLHVLNRLGYGPNPAELDKIKRIGIDAYINQQLNTTSQPLPNALLTQLNTVASRQSLQQIAGAYNQFVQQNRANAGATDSMQATANREAQQAFINNIATAASSERILRATYSPNQLEEVMTDFWYNHFNVYKAKTAHSRIFFQDYEKNAIRPYALGKFKDLLVTTAHHPAMLSYLDNWLSSTPRQLTRDGKTTTVGGINENYAREIMELHTLGVNGGYTQADVTALARILSGWSYSLEDIAAGKPFTYKRAAHDSTAKTWLGQNFPAGQQQDEGERALDILARSPATARHIATELVTYFVSDNPPASLVSKLQGSFLQSSGDIKQVLKVLFNSPEFWDEANVGQKFKPPLRYLVSSLRASNLPRINPVLVNQELNSMGMPLYGSVTPDGYGWTEQKWMSPNALKLRIAYAAKLGNGQLFNDRRNADNSISYNIDPKQLYATLSPTLASKTAQLFKTTNPNMQSTLLLGSPDFMRY